MHNGYGATHLGETQSDGMAAAMKSIRAGVAATRR